MQRYDLQGHPIVEPRAPVGAAILATLLLGVADVLEPKPPRDLGAEVVAAPTDEPRIDLDFGPLDPLP
ncbi:MAG: hypothetical protein U5K29_13040 [Acidimicrobiales bacterium]|nr:hypothetical protein [Acidimicrobiales bacterium]